MPFYPLVMVVEGNGETLLFSSLPGGYTYATLQIVGGKEVGEPILFFFHPHPDSITSAARELFTGLVVPQTVAPWVCAGRPV